MEIDDYNFVYGSLDNFSTNLLKSFENSSYNPLNGISSVIIVSENDFSYKFTSTIVNSLRAAAEDKSISLTSKNIKTISIPSGEVGKDLNIVQFLWNYLIQIGADRKTLIISVGGGATSDCVGFVASTFMRGVKFAIVPTTLLSIVDASMGGKTAINFKGTKNMIGSFYKTDFIYVDIDVLKTLSEEQYLSGYAEAIKLGCLVGGNLFELVRSNNSDIQKIIMLSQEAKTSICKDDFYDQTGKRAQLNFGHTLAHALELTYNIPHGLAVAVGMDFSAFLALNERLSTNQVYNELHEILVQSKVWGCALSFLDSDGLTGLDVDIVRNIMLHDKKMVNGSVNYIVLENFGKPFVYNITLENIAKNLVKYIKLCDTTVS